jgi:hypothetical protein
MGLHDPDGFYVEVIWRKPSVPDAQILKRDEWKTVDLGWSVNALRSPGPGAGA